ncbi:UNVERIFIED_CONTAM: hypothetical protein FKN15_015024 [Acipenser sinensis]
MFLAHSTRGSPTTTHLCSWLTPPEGAPACTYLCYWCAPPEGAQTQLTCLVESGHFTDKACHHLVASR